MDSQQLLIYGFTYFGLLILLAWIAERTGGLPRIGQAVIYALSLGVYCSSWTFLGAVGNASNGGWSFLPIYLGPILLFVFAWPFVRRLMVIGARNKVTSIADFIGSRYGKDQRLAALVTLVAVIGTLPYIALQLRAIALAWSSANVTDWLQPFAIDNSASFFAAIFLGWFAIVFGTRIIDGQHKHRGLLAAVATESIVKLIAFIGLAGFALYLLATLPEENSAAISSSSHFNSQAFTHINFYTQLILAAAAIICLPRQFHVMVVAYHDRLSTRMSRWMFPLYLMIFALCVIPIVEAGRLLMAGSSIPADSYVLSLPGLQGQPWLTLLAFIGTLSAATSMVIMATLALSIMVSNELIVPFYLRTRAKAHLKNEDLASALSYVRRFSIIAVLFLSWLLEQVFSNTGGLSSMGLLAFASSAQLLPAIIAGLYWSQGHRKGVFAGIICGCITWAYCLLLPAIISPEHSLLIQGPWGIHWLNPQSLLGTGQWLDSLTHGVVWSLGLNIMTFLLISKRATFTSLDLRQSNAFLELRRRYSYSKQDFEPTAIEVRRLQSLINPLLGDSAHGYWIELERKLQHRLLPYVSAPRFVVNEVEKTLSSIIGAVSAHRAIDMLRKQKPIAIEDMATLMDDTSQQLRFSQSLLQTTLENIPQGISVVDENLNLVAWNQQYEKLFNYPPQLLYVGCPIERIYRFNALKGMLLNRDDDIDSAVAKRLVMLKSGKPYRLERRLPNNVVIEIQGTPIPSGGYVTAFTDVTAYHNIMEELEDAKQGLEIRVKERTEALSAANESLQQENEIRARIEKELKQVHTSKSRFLAAASHDLLQPINAARLLVAAINRQNDNGDISEISHVDSALASAESVVSSLREVARLDSGKLKPNPEPIALHAILESLAREFTPFADRYHLELHYCKSSLWINTDHQLLKRILQNLLSNAMRYTRHGKVLLGSRRHGDAVAIEVWDTGPGIAEQDQKRIFDEFERVNVHSNEDVKGLGLGLSIALGLAQLLGHSLELKSTPGKGSVFRIMVPIAKAVSEKAAEAPTQNDPALKNIRILCLDNEPHLLAGLQAILSQWGCEVTTAGSLSEIMQMRQLRAPDLMIADYNLDNNETGLDALETLKVHWNKKLPAIVISADNSAALQNKVKEIGYSFLAKPVQPSTLRLTLRKLLRQIKSTD